jgi:hypothetical protein
VAAVLYLKVHIGVLVLEIRAKRKHDVVGTVTAEATSTFELYRAEGVRKV